MTDQEEVKEDEITNLAGALTAHRFGDLEIFIPRLKPTVMICQIQIYFRFITTQIKVSETVFLFFLKQVNCTETFKGPLIHYLFVCLS